MDNQLIIGLNFTIKDRFSGDNGKMSSSRGKKSFRFVRFRHFSLVVDYKDFSSVCQTFNSKQYFPDWAEV
jgi:hypothetical protein